MCPVCFSTIAMITAGAGSAGGLAAVFVTKVRKKAAPPASPESNQTAGSESRVRT
jgi:hypothetical protein